MHTYKQTNRQIHTNELTDLYRQTRKNKTTSTDQQTNTKKQNNIN